jgi:hypothetical protein
MNEKNYKTNRAPRAIRVIRALRDILLISLITLVLLELTSWIYLAVSQKLGYGSLYSLKKNYLADLDPGADVEQDIMFNNQRMQLHPYFGYTLVPKSKAHINNAGYPSNKDYPYWGSKDEFVVGIFGGSVAIQMYGFFAKSKLLQQTLLPLLKDRGYKRLTLLNFSLAGGKQPISLFAFAYYINTMDMAIFIEGFNECHQYSSNTDVSGYPGDFPKWAYWKALAQKRYSPYTIKTIGMLEIKKDRRRRFTESVTSSLLGRSMFVHLIWKTYIDRLERSEHRLREQLLNRQNETLTYKDIVPEGLTPDERTTIFLEKYMKYIEMADTIGKRYRVPCFFIIQPNQYLRGSKPLSGEEREKFTAVEALHESVNRLYPGIIDMYERLSADGIAALDLTRTFNNTRETVYKDACCHFNDLGKKIFGRAITAKILKPDKHLDIISDAGNRPHRLMGIKVTK